MQEQRQSEPANKFDGTKDKLRWDLLPVQALEEVVKVYSRGAKKYGDRNWESGMSWSRFFAAAMRHLWAFWRGETYDKETGLSHTAHAAWNCLALTQFLFTQQKFDDRIKCGKKNE